MTKKVVKKAVAKKAAPTKKAPTKKPIVESKIVPSQQGTNGREVIYPEPDVKLRCGDNPLTAEDAKLLFGWQEEPAGKKFGDDFVKEIRALMGIKVRLHNNVTNRPIYIQIVHNLAQEILRKRWRLNFETIIIGKTGLVLNGQHSLFALILAVYLWNKDKDKYPEWETEPTMDKLVGFGCDESDDVVNTMDTCKPRSLSDCIYRSDLFKSLSNKDRRVCAKICEFAVRLVWHRIGVGNAFSSGLRGTHAEFLDFIERHPKILDCVKHIFEEEGEGEDKGKISNLISCGYAAGMLYLMGCSKSDPSSYRASEAPNENMLDWQEADKAEEFFVMLAGRDKSVRAVREAIGNAIADDDSSINTKAAILIKGWLLYSEGKDITVEDLALKYTTDEDGVRTLNEFPTVGGIDIGGHKTEPDVEVTDDEVKANKAQVDKERNAASTDAAKATKKATKKAVKDTNKKPATGDIVYVVTEPGVFYKGQLEGWRGSSKGVMGRIKVIEPAQFAGTIEEAPQDALSLTEPD